MFNRGIGQVATVLDCNWGIGLATGVCPGNCRMGTARCFRLQG